MTITAPTLPSSPISPLMRGCVAAFVLGTVAFAGCGGEQASYRYNRKKAQKALTKLEDPGLVIGEFTLARKAVVDGDTLKVDGLDSSLRLLAIDTEEIYHHKENKRMAETDFAAYLEKKRAEGHGKPPKTGTPLGVAAGNFGKDFFAGVKTVRLERDHPKEIRGRYNRYLAYVFVKKRGQWLNYNLECVRAGMSPYFTKYGYSRRFHKDFVAAQQEARAAKRGIWAPNAKAYDDYPVRLEWWNNRAEFVKQFEMDARGHDDMVALTNWDAIKRIEDHTGKEIEVLATVGSVRIGDRGPTKVMLSRRMNADFPLIFFDRDVFGTSGIGRYKGEFVRVRGVVNKYRNKYRNRDELQIIVHLPGQVRGSKLPAFRLPASAPAASTTSAKGPS